MARGKKPYQAQLEDMDAARREGIRRMGTTDLVLSRLAAEAGSVMYYKALRADEKYGYHGNEWMDDRWEAEWRRSLREHIAKGDPRDVMLLAAFGWYHGWSTAGPEEVA